MHTPFTQWSWLGFISPQVMAQEYLAKGSRRRGMPDVDV
jgi:hypothetical protein